MRRRFVEGAEDGCKGCYTCARLCANARAQARMHAAAKSGRAAAHPFLLVVHPHSLERHHLSIVLVPRLVDLS